MKTILATALCLAAALTTDLTAAEYHVSLEGDDRNSGTLEKPFRTLAHAQAVVRAGGQLGKEPVTVFLHGGVYSLDQTLTFSAEDSGAADAPVRYAAFGNEPVVLSGGLKLAPEWKPHRDGILQTAVPAGLEIDQLFANGQRQHMARYPNYDAEARPYNGAAADAFSPERAKRWADPTGGFIHAMHRARWGGYHFRITGKQPDHVVTYEGGWQNNRQGGMHERFRFVENIYEELDAPGEWFHDRGTNILYYKPVEGLDVGSASFEIVRLRHLVELRGTRERPVRHIEMRGIVFRHTARTFMETREPLLRSDWTIYRGGAVVFENAEDCAIADCEFDQVGGNAVFVSNYNRRIAVRGTHIHGAGASGVCFVGDPASVRNPLFEYHQRLAYSDIDKTPGPKTDNHPADCAVEDCLIHDIGLVEKQATGVQISMSKGITVRHCSIYDVGRAGINISEGTFGGHLIEFCDVFDTVRETGDHGSFNSWGRDRFWMLKEAPDKELPELALLDAAKTVIRNSRWRCDHGWDIDLDDGSSNYEIYNNLMLAGGLKLREGFHRLVYNNITINNSLHPHVWYDNSGDVIRGNIWMTRYRPIKVNRWGREVDRNLFLADKDLKESQARQCDLHSVAGDPLFVDPAKGDFRVREGSPAFAIGFQNFPMDRFGVLKPELKAIARVPEIPELELAQDGAESTEPSKTVWLGATVAALGGEEYSAFGVSKEDGGIHLVQVPAKSEAAAAGFQSGDLVQQVDGKPVKTLTALQQATRKSRGRAVKISLVRQQSTMTLTLGK